MNWFVCGVTSRPICTIFSISLGDNRLMWPMTHRRPFSGTSRSTSDNRSIRPGEILALQIARMSFEARCAVGMIGLHRDAQGTGPVRPRESEELPKPDQLRQWLHLAFDKYSGRLSSSVLFDR